MRSRPGAGRQVKLTRPRTDGRDTWVVLGVLVLYLATQYPHAIQLPFVNDDYAILDLTRHASFAVLWKRTDLLFGWYRPWSRELHYWTIQRLFGATEVPFHLVSMALWLGIILLYYALVRRLAGRTTAAISTAGVTALALWGAPLLWAAGAQDLWALLFALAFMHAVVRGNLFGAIIALPFALMSKESTAALPIVAAGYWWAVERRPTSEVARRALPLVAIAAVWVFAHPTLGARFLGPLATSAETAHRLPPTMTAIRTLLAQVNLDAWPRPQGSEWTAIARGTAGAALLVGLIQLVRDRGAGAARAERRSSLVILGGVWAIAGWSPLFMPSIGWHAYYGVLGSLGAWMSIGVLLTRWPRTAMAVVATVAILRAAQALTLSWDWGSEWYQHRAGNILRVIRSELLQQRPALPPHSRVYFARIPNNIGLLAGDGPSLRVWYGDSTLRAHYYSEYQPRPAGMQRGQDFFFVVDTTTGLREVRQGPEDVAAVARRYPGWEHDHSMLAALFARTGNTEGAIGEYRKMARLPDRWEYDVLAGVLLQVGRDMQGADSCYRLAAVRAGYTTEAVRDSAQRLVLQLLQARHGGG